MNMVDMVNVKFRMVQMQYSTMDLGMVRVTCSKELSGKRKICNASMMMKKSVWERIVKTAQEML